MAGEPSQPAGDPNDRRMAELQERLAEAELRIATLRQDGADRVSAERQVRFHETAILTRRIEEDRSASAQLTAENAGLRKQLAALRKERERQAAKIARLQERSRKQEARIEALLNSISWRITAPLRRIRAALMRRTGS